MGNPYTSVSISGYNANPPSDDGTQASQNEVEWAKHKTKLGDPLKTAIEAIDTNVSTAFAAADVPPGVIASYAGTTAPSGWLICDGTTGLNSVSDTTLADLFGVIGVQYGGTGAADFDLPDLRGEFIRGFDNSAGNDPDAASRTDRGDGTTGDAIGTKQGHAVEAHTHDEPAGGSFVTGGSGVGNGAGSSGQAANETGEVSSSDAGNKTAATTSANETRGRNVCFNFIIKK